jgi:hypothetical protein
MATLSNDGTVNGSIVNSDIIERPHDRTTVQKLSLRHWAVCKEWLVKPIYQ